jgi:hypothetical protein
MLVKMLVTSTLGMAPPWEQRLQIYEILLILYKNTNVKSLTFAAMTNLQHVFYSNSGKA